MTDPGLILFSEIKALELDSEHQENPQLLNCT
jgi:hypothetical protein